MSDLLQGIIDSATDGQHSLSDLLRMCLRLGYELKNLDLQKWAEAELNGYDLGVDVPSYRILFANAYGQFECYGGKWFEKHLIPPSALEPPHREWATRIRLPHGVSAFHNLTNSAKAEIIFQWPPDMVVYYQERLMRGCVCHAAWQSISPNSLTELLDIVRNRTLKMALEVRNELGDAYNPKKITAPEIERAAIVIVNNIGGTNYQTFDKSNLDASHPQTVVIAGDLHSLTSKLLESGMTESDIGELKEAIRDDETKGTGSTVQEWIKKHGPNLLSGGIKAGVKVGTALATEWLKQYYGLK